MASFALFGESGRFQSPIVGLFIAATDVEIVIGQKGGHPRRIKQLVKNSMGIFGLTRSP
ncbi:MAG: hypothetical protein HOH92_00245 [Crocinitomicaceae bacterium]|nr:hypothetical protein [Crocinitomicaceae bacterium]